MEVSLRLVSGITVVALVVIGSTKSFATEVLGGTRIESFYPPTGSSLGGTTITIRGSGFQPGAAVLLGGKLCTIHSKSADTFSCTVPPHPTGMADLEVVNPDGSRAKSSNGYIYVSPPIVSRVSPDFGELTGDTVVTLFGMGFQGNPSVLFNGETCEVLNTSSTLIQCKTRPFRRPQIVSIEVRNTDSQSSVLEGAFEFVAPPMLARVVPSAGPSSGGITLMLGGTGFDSRPTVTVGGNPCIISGSSSTAISCQVGPGQAGRADVRVTNRNGESHVLPGVFSFVEPPSVALIHPRVGQIEGGDVVDIYGRGFQPGVMVLIGGVACGPVRRFTTDWLRCVTGRNSSGAKDVVITLPGGGTATAVKAFDYQSNVPKPACAQVVSVARSCDRPGNAYEAAAAFAPTGPYMLPRNGMSFDELLPYVPAPVSGTFLADACDKRPPHVARAPFPSTMVARGHLLNLMTNGNVGSLDCPAYFTTYYNPLVIDLKGEGIELSRPNEGVSFDIEGNGVKQPLAWVKNGNAVGFLALDSNHNGRIDSLGEVLGTNYGPSDSKRALNGFELLKKFDENKDGFLDSRDKIFNDLLVWNDRNSDGDSSEQELSSLKTTGISRLDLEYALIRERQDYLGNERLATSAADMSDGSLRRVVDLWLIPGKGQ